jgi:hypothetical protein
MLAFYFLQPSFYFIKKKRNIETFDFLKECSSKEGAPGKKSFRIPFF